MGIITKAKMREVLEKANLGEEHSDKFPIFLTKQEIDMAVKLFELEGLIKEEKFIIVLSDVHLSSSYTPWEYAYLAINEDNEIYIDYTDNEENIEKINKEDLEKFPEWAKALAKEVK